MATQERRITAEDEIRALESRRKIDVEGETAGNEMKCDCVAGLRGRVSACVFVAASLHAQCAARCVYFMCLHAVIIFCLWTNMHFCLQRSLSACLCFVRVIEFLTRR